MDFFKKILGQNGQSGKADSKGASAEPAPEFSALTLSDEDKDALHTALKHWVQGGFDDLETIEESAEDFFRPAELNGADKAYIAAQIKKYWTDKQKEESTWSGPGDFEKIEAAFERIESQKIIALHCAGYTKSDARDDAVELWHEQGAKDSDILGYCYYHGQDVEGVVDTGELYIGFDSFTEADQAMKVAAIVGDALKAQGLTVVMPEDATRRIAVTNLVWRKKSPRD